MKVLVIGLGSMGKRRVRCLQHLGIGSVYGYDVLESRRLGAAQEYHIDLLDALQAHDIERFDVVLVSTPPDQHHTYIEWAINAGRPCFVEASVIRAPLLKLCTLARTKQVLVAPSCTLRFHPAIRDVTDVVKSGRYGKVCNFSYHCGQFLPDWHPWEKVSDYYVSNPLTGGAREIVPFELTWMVDALGWPMQVTGWKMKTTDVGASIDDTYAVLLRYQDFLGSLVVDVAARQAVRKLTLNLETASLSWDWDEGIVRIYEAQSQRTVELHQPKIQAHSGYHHNIGEAMYIDEIISFLGAAAGRSTYAHSLEDDIRVLELLETIERESTRIFENHLL